MDEVGKVTVPGLTFTPVAEGNVPRKLEDAIGPTNGRIHVMQHINRSKFALEHIPETAWPCAGKLTGRFKGRGVIVGGGPSLNWDLIKAEAEARDRGEDVVIFAPNRSHDEAVSRGIIPDFGCLLDPAEHIVEYVTPRDDVMYLISTTVHWKVLSQFLKAEARCFFFVPVNEEDGADVDAILPFQPERPKMFVSGGCTVGLRLANIVSAYGLEPHLHGFDSCYAPGSKELYAYDKPWTCHEVCGSTVVAEDGSQFKFLSTNQMAKQAFAFRNYVRQLPAVKVNDVHCPKVVTVHGDGLIPWMAWKDSGTYLRHADPGAMELKYGKHKAWDYHKDRPCEPLRFDANGNPLPEDQGISHLKLVTA